MTDPEPQTLARLEGALAAAARRFVAENRMVLEAAEGRRLIEAVCRRLGCASAVATAIADGSADATTRTSVIERFESESAMLRRLGRCGDPAYDVNRHIAVHRALRMLDDHGPATTPSRPPSGSELNRRFADGKRARRRPTPRPSPPLHAWTATELAVR